MARGDGRVPGASTDQLALVMAELEQARAILSRTTCTLTNLGVMTGRIYIQSAVGNVGVGLECCIAASDRRKRRFKAGGHVEAPPVLRPQSRSTHLGTRARNVDVSYVSSQALRSLAVDLVGSAAVKTFVKDPVSAGLLCAALWQSRWFHFESGTEWSIDCHGACLMISVLTDGRSFPSWSMTELNGLSDAQSVQLIAGLGWSRLRPPSIKFTG